MRDTHGCWDDRFAEHFSDCDEVWHAGDIGDYAIVEKLQDVVPVVRAVSGNIDHGMVRRKCQELEIFDVEGVRVLLTHIGGYPGKWSKGMKSLLIENGIGLMVDGHSHILKVIFDKELQLLHINPGAAGMFGWHSVRTLVKLTIDGSDMRDCEVIELAGKGRTAK